MYIYIYIYIQYIYIYREREREKILVHIRTHMYIHRGLEGLPGPAQRLGGRLPAAAGLAACVTCNTTI